MRRALRPVLLAAGVAMVPLGGCGEDAPTSSPSPVPDSAGPSSSTPRQGVSGEAVLTDDTGLADRPDGGGGIAVIPDEAAAKLWPLVGLDEEPTDLAHTGFAIDDAQVQQLGGVIVPVAGDGTFTIERSGPVLLCRLRDSAESGTVEGCTRADLPSTGTLKLTDGEGGFRSVEP